jgi:hypothetical protein
MAIGLEQGQRTSSRRSLPHSIGALTGLHVLNLSFNQLTTLPDSIAALTGLTELNLCNNELLGRNSHSPAVTTWIARLRQHPRNHALLGAPCRTVSTSWSRHPRK